MHTTTAHTRLEQQLSDAQALAHLGSWDWDLLAGRLTWSDEHYRIFGLRPGDPIAVDEVMRRVHPADLPKVTRTITQSLEDGHPYRLECRIVRPDGVERIVEVQAAFEVDASGRPTRKYGTVQDITDRRRAEAALRASERRYEDLIRRTQDIFFRLRPDGTIASLNPAFEAILGWPIAEWLGRSWAPIIHTLDLPRTQEVVAGVLRGERVTSIDVRVRARDGALHTFEYTAMPESEDGVVVAVQGMARDVTARRQAEAQLAIRVAQQEALARLAEEALVGGALEPLYRRAVSLAAEMLPVDDATLFELAPSGREFLLSAGVGWSAGLAGTLSVPADERYLVGYTLASPRAVIVEDYARETRFEVLPVSRAHRVVSGLSVIVGARSRPFGVLGVESRAARRFGLDDVSCVQGMANVLALAIQRHRADDVRRHLLERAISAQEEERRRVAHELHDQTGQTLSAILVGLRSAEEAATPGATQGMVRRLRRLAGECARDVDRIARGLRPSVLDDLGLHAAIERLAEDLHSSGGLAVRVRGHPGDRLLPPVETTLYRIIQEALTNVLRHAHAGGVTVTLAQRDGVVEAMIVDDGRGFDVTQISAARRALGLAGMRERAALLGGTVTIESTVGAGTSVTVRLPCCI